MRLLERVLREDAPFGGWKLEDVGELDEGGGPLVWADDRPDGEAI